MNTIYKKLNKDDLHQSLLLFKKLKEEAAEVTYVDIVEKKQVENWLHQPNYYIYVAIIDEKIVGFFRGVRGLSNESHGILITIAIDPDYRNRHIAKSLILYSLDDIKKKEKNISLARAYVYSNNKASINTMLCCGFTISGSVYQHHFDAKTKTYIDDVIFHKILE
ncbi:Acetyltransferase (GNAT) family protein [Natronincola peptidivorans]|uniref:Acetyltransferase (GNAT) family protein n=1 Tax=Natronincola peptidivorans TaxID=426128 RepID=A0A1I0EZW3_9FIRM|nr:GNAT family N-acetyltransferase [Natronincola peptidivorans]SET50668.1 Acetyltransferase (GNAT) family protein [Natronincola peptidivorans]